MINSLRNIFLLGMMSLLSGCFKDFKEEYLFTDFMVEFDAATWESRAPGKPYPILGPLAKGSGIHTYQVNLIGRPKDTDQEVRYRVVAEETTAIEGVHFRLADAGTFTIGANQTTGSVAIEVLDFPSAPGADTVVLELVGSDVVRVSENYKQLGLTISLTGPPSESHPLHEQLGPESFFNSIYLDPLNLALPSDIQNRLAQSAANLAAFADGTRRLQNMYLYFDTQDIVRVVAQYYGGGGNSLTAGPVAIWTYKMVLNAQGEGKLEFQEANGNGNTQRANFAPILADYLEQHTFRVDWMDPGTITPPEGRQLGGLFRTDDPSSFLFGTLESLNATGTIRPLPQAPSVHDMFNNGQGGYYTTLLIDPEDAVQSSAFRTRWQEGKTHIAGLQGRQLHQLMLYFNPAFNFQDVRFATFYLSAAGGRFIGQVRCQFRVDTDGTVQSFEFIFQDGNGSATRAPHIMDNFLMAEQFTMSRSGDRVRFTSVADPEVYFEGELGNRPLNVNEFWPE